MKDHPSKGVGEISKVLSAEWSNMSEEDKSMYVRMSEEDKVRYQKVRTSNDLKMLLILIGSLVGQIVLINYFDGKFKFVISSE